MRSTPALCRWATGDGRVSSGAKAGHVFACNTQFRQGGARHAGDWIQGTTWDATRKVWVQGNVLWPNAQFDIQTFANQRVLVSNALPVGHATGSFPVARTDPAYPLDRNPNAINAQTLESRLPLQPTVAATPSCVPMGVVGMSLNGVPIFNALDDAGLDAVANEVQDRCQSHPQARGVYHYHGPSDCAPGTHDNAALVGYALDGFGIYSGRMPQPRGPGSVERQAAFGLPLRDDPRIPVHRGLLPRRARGWTHAAHRNGRQSQSRATQRRNTRAPQRPTNAARSSGERLHQQDRRHSLQLHRTHGTRNQRPMPPTTGPCGHSCLRPGAALRHNDLGPNACAPLARLTAFDGPDTVHRIHEPSGHLPAVMNIAPEGYAHSTGG
jgi:hypothetical protein